ncbi:hypothetical protein B0T22DRAFT_428678 [Podospora appendiculata]|uniref:Rhodopsin domain-containing protein n=1 Tax=Podospora appendiculata TaxID=314037 RepID=A0AAE1CA59_9PEZI|nr:hypothetical protein B0T22DRAFT_428678 [Podospora appendiculata]
MADSGPVAILALLPPPTTINDTHKVYSIALGCAFMCAVASSFVLWRLYTRVTSRSFGLDDCGAVFALLCYIAWSTMAVYANLHAGVGKPLWEITMDEYTVWFQVIVGCAFLYPIMSAAIRVSILLFYHRLFAVRGSAFRLANYALMAAQAVFMTVFVILPVFACTPIYAAWTLSLYPSSCRVQYFEDITTALYGASLGFDVILTVLPLWPISKLQIPLKQRAGIAFLFLVGTSATTAAAYKLAIWVWNLSRTWSGDPTWLSYQLSPFIPAQFDSYGVTYWIPSQVEPTLALICTSLPALKPVLVKIGRAIGSTVASLSPKRSVDGVSPSRPVLMYAAKKPRVVTIQGGKVPFHNSGSNHHSDIDAETGSEAGLKGDYFRLDEVSAHERPGS